MSNRSNKKQARESDRFVLSLLIPAIITIIGAILATTGGFDMNVATVLLIVCGALSIVALLFIPVEHGVSKHLMGIVVLIVLFGGMIWWIRSYDRPIFEVSIGGLVISQGSLPAAIYVESSVENIGLQSSFADQWEAQLIDDGKEYEGKQHFGQRFPVVAMDQVANETEIYNQEFPPGKPVRGWLFFAFQDLPRSSMNAFATCDMTIPTDAVLRLSVRDSKTHTIWIQRKSIAQMRAETCRRIFDKH